MAILNFLHFPSQLISSDGYTLASVLFAMFLTYYYSLSGRVEWMGPQEVFTNVCFRIVHLARLLPEPDIS